MIASTSLARGGVGLSGIGDGHRRPFATRQDHNAVSSVPAPATKVPAGGSPGSGPPRKFFSASTDEISESSLAEGFSFPSMQDLQEGHLSNPMASDTSQTHPTSPRVSPVNRSSTDKPSESLVSPFFNRAVPGDAIGAAPPEDPIANRPSDNGNQKPKQLHSLNHGSGHSPQNSPQDTQRQDSNAALRLRIQNLKNMSRHSGPTAELAPKNTSNGKPSSSSSSPERPLPKRVEHVDLTEEPPHKAPNPHPDHGFPPKLVTSADVQEAMRSVTDASRARDTLRTPDFVPLHSRRRSQLSHVASPAPFRADPTSSVHPSPALSKRHSRHRWDNRPLSQERDRMSRHGSQPRVSGVVKKKTSHHRGASRSDLDRKKAAMYQVAQYWNECIRLAEEENVQANLEIDKLSEELYRQDTKVQDLRSSLDRKDKKLDEMEGLLQKLLEEKGRVVEEKQHLGREIESLRTEISDSKNQYQSIDEKFRVCQGQLEQANQEQEALSARVEQSQEMIDGLCEEKNKITADSVALVKVIDEGRTEREQLEKSIENIHATTQIDLMQKEQIISELKLKIEKSDAELLIERETSNRLRAQIENELKSSQTVRQLELKLDSLLASSDVSESERQKEQQENAAFIGHVQTKLEAILAAHNLSSANALTMADLEHTLQASKEEIISRILPTLSSLSTDHAGLNGAVSHLQTSVENGLQVLHEHLTQQGVETKSYGQATQNLAEGSTKLLESCEEALNASKNICQQVELRVEAWMNTERQACEDTMNLRLTEAQSQLQERGEHVKILEEKLSQAQDDNAAKLDALDACISSNGEETISTVQSAANGLRDLLGEEIKSIKEMTERMICLNENTSAAFMAQWKETQKAVGSLQNGQQCDELRTQDHSEVIKAHESVVATLESRIQQLEGQLKAHSKLGEQWRQDMKDLDVIRGKYKQLLERLPVMQGIGAKIERVMELNTSIESTSQYLANETSWIGEQLHGQAESASRTGESIDVDSGKITAIVSALPAVARAVPHLEKNGADSPIKGPHVLKDAIAFRRVTVHSPTPREGSPESPDPPSVRQEQKRRREATQVRPILKQHTPFLKGSNYQSVDFSHLIAQHLHVKSQALAGHQSAGIAATSLARQRGYHFPTLADFESSTQTSNSEQQSSGSKHPLSQGGDDDYDDDDDDEGGQFTKKRKKE